MARTSIIVLSLLAIQAHAAVDAAVCESVQKKVGGLLYITVDGNGAPNGDHIHPAYLKLIKEMDPAGILTHGTHSIDKTRAGYKAAREASPSGLLVGVDYQAIKVGDDTRKVGLGYGGGLVSKRTAESQDACFEQVAYLEAFLHKSVGLNHALGPTIENNPKWGVLAKDAATVKKMSDPVFKSFERFGVATTMKHFPYTPETFNLHTMSEDVKTKPADVDRMLEIFKLQGPQADFAMSTHIYNSQIDKEDMATFSKKWISKLRNECGYDGLLMSDALFMISRYDESMKSLATKWDASQAENITDEQTVFAARTILSGHDIVFLDGTSADHRRVWGNLKKIACADSELGKELRARILESSKRVKKYKADHAEELKTVPDVGADVMDRASKLHDQVMNSGFTACPLADFKLLQSEIEALGIAKGPAPVFKDCVNCSKKSNKDNMPLDPKVLPNYEVIVEPDPIHNYE